MLRYKKKYNAHASLALFLLLLLLSFSTLAETVAVIYPDIREPYLSVFKEIVNGIDKPVKKLKEFRIKKGVTKEEVHAWIEKKQVTQVVALGNKGLQYAKGLPDEIPVVVGAILLPPEGVEGMSGITLSPSPDQLFSRLRQLSSKIKTVTVIYSEKNNAWLVNYAKKAAKTHKLNFRAMPANDLAAAANLYRDILQEPLDGTHAIWLLQDKLTVDSKTMLPMILNQAWKKKFIVFSSNPAYVKRGILFSLFPDNTAMGNSLGALINESVKKTSIKKSVFLPLTDLKIAVNVRAAEHLGLALEKSEQREFDLIFPPQR